MTWVLVVLAALAGFGLGRWYAWAKYSYPENVEMIRVKVAKQRAERAKYEAEEERLRAKINDSLDERLRS